jgi:hypothetical protein
VVIVGTYFKNEELDALWARLVLAVETLIEDKLVKCGVKDIHDALITYCGLQRNK